MDQLRRTSPYRGSYSQQVLCFFKHCFEKGFIAETEFGGIFEYKIDQVILTLKISAMIKHLINRAPPKMSAKAPAKTNAKAHSMKPAKALFRANHESGGIFTHKINQVILKHLLKHLIEHLLKYLT